MKITEDEFFKVYQKVYFKAMKRINGYPATAEIKEALKNETFFICMGFKQELQLGKHSELQQIANKVTGSELVGMIKKSRA